jgi:hypothetical protein
VGAGINADLVFLVVAEPVVTRHEGVVFVDLAEALLPVVEFAGGKSNPVEEATSRDVGLVAPVADEIDDRIAGIVWRPATG